MDRANIIIPEKVSIGADFGETLQKLNSLTSKEVPNFNFEKVSFVNPDMLMMLVTSSKLAYDRAQHPVVWSGLRPEVYSYLERLDAGNLEFISLKRPASAKKYHRASNGSDNLVELSAIKNWKEIGGAVTRTRGVVNRWLPEKSPHYRNNLITLLKETVENSIDHSSEHPQEGTCYYVVQKYTAHNKGVQLQIAVGDVGVGMLTSLRRVFPETKDDIAAICGALIDGKSGRKTGGGMGYLSIRQALLELRGTLLIRSGQGIVYYDSLKDRPQIYRKNTQYPGTQVFFVCAG